MSNLIRSIAIVLLGLWAGSGHASASTVEEKPVTIFAAASLTRAMEAVSKLAQRRGFPSCRCVYAASSTLAWQLVARAPADIYLSANTKWMRYAIKQGVIERRTVRVPFKNRLVLITPADKPFKIDLIKGARLDKAMKGGWLAIANPDHVPAGLYAKSALHILEMWPNLKHRIARTANVRATLALVARGEAAAGIVYETDLVGTRDVTIGARFPVDSHPPIRYMAALVARQERHDKALTYLEFLSSEAALKLFAKFGFSPANAN